MKDQKLAVPSRRSILGTGLAALLGGRLPVLGAGPVDRVLVCIYLFGGNDSNNMIVPLDQMSAYLSARGDLAIPAGSLLPVRSVGSQATYLFHPALAEVRNLFESRALAVVSNVGRRTATQPTESAHLDGSLVYLSDGFVAPGWAMALSGGKSIFTHFDPSSPYNSRGGTSLISPGGPSSENLVKIVHSSLRSELLLQTQFPDTGLGSQLRQIAKVISLSNLKQQVYLCPLNGFDTASDQSTRQEALFRELSQSMAAFYQATVELGVDKRVTVFTDTEFNRTLVPNKANGTEHGWGGHQLALGGSVLGGNVYGRFPTLVTNGPDDASGTGAWTPGISKEQYAATFAKWLGVNAPDLNRLFPALQETAPGTLEFLS